MYFPREILPLSVTLSGFVNFFISCIFIILFCIFGGVGPVSYTHLTYYYYRDGNVIISAGGYGANCLLYTSFVETSAEIL